MRRLVVAFLTGVVFALGLGLSGMTRPSKVLGFLDVTGRWDPSLLCVMGGAVLLGLAVFPRILRRGAPRFDVTFHLPKATRIDARLLAGSAIFGLGWGLAGVCPGPAIVALATGSPGALLFVSSMALGMALSASLDAVRSRHSSLVSRVTLPGSFIPEETDPGRLPAS